MDTTKSQIETAREMVDFHSHILPNVDDGSSSVEESLKLLESSAAQGVTTIAATPHFYASQDNPEHFLERREEAYQRLKSVWNPEFPQILLGAEVYYYSGICQSDVLTQMRLEGTPLLMVEMPFTKWSGWMMDEILELNEDPEIQVVLAHIDRYLSMNHPRVLDEFLENGVLMQANAESFLNWRKRRQLLRMLQQGDIHFLGSDCHSLTSRPPCLGEAVQVIEKKLGIQATRQILDSEKQYILPETATI